MPTLDELLGMGGDAASVGAGLLGSAVSLTPMALALRAVSSGFRNREGRGPIRVQPNLLKEQGTLIGQRVRRVQEQTERRQAKQMERVAKSLEDTEAIRKVLTQSSDQRKALLQSLIVALDRPEFAQDAQVGSLRGQIADILRLEDNQISEDVQKTILRVVDTIKDATSDDVREDFSRASKQYQGIASQITAYNPLNRIQGLSPRASKVDPSPGLFREFGGGAESIFNRLSADVRGQGQIELQVVDEMMHGGRKVRGLYAQVFDRHGQHVFATPLHMARIEGVPFLRTGQDFQTLRFTNPLFGDAPGMLRVLDTIPQEALDHGLSPQEVDQYFTSKGLLVRPEEQYYREFQKRFRNRGSNLSSFSRLDRNELGVWQRAHGKEIPRLASLREDLQVSPLTQRYSRYLRHGARTQASFMTFVGFEDLTPQQQQQFRPKLLSSLRGDFFDAFSPGEVARVDDGRSTFQFAEGGLMGFEGTRSHFTGVRAPGVVTRASLPVTARLHQVVGRQLMFVPPSVARANRTLGRGGVFQAFGDAAGFMDGFLPESMNRVAFLDVRGGRLGLGEGEAYLGGGVRVMGVSTKTVFDPEIDKSSRQLLDELMQRAGKRRSIVVGKMPGVRSDYSDIRKFFQQFGGVLGRGSAGEAFLPRFHGLTGFELLVSEVSTNRGRKQIHIEMPHLRMIDQGTKIQGPAFKGTVQSLHRRGQRVLEERIPGFAEQMHHYGLRHRDILIAEADNVFKSADYVAMQMTGAMGLLPATGRRRVGSYGELVDQVERSAQLKGVTDTRTRLTRIAKRLAIRHRAAGSSDEVAAAAMTVFTRAAQERRFGLQPEDAERVVGRILGKNALDIARSGSQLAPMVSGFTPGPQPGDYRDAMGSMEPRYLKLLHSRLRQTYGLSTTETSRLLGNVLLRKPGAGAHLQTVQGMLRMQASLVNEQGMLSGLSGTPSVTVRQFLEQTSGQGDEVVDFLNRHAGGVRVRLDEAEHLRTGAGLALKGGDEIFLPGGDALRSMRGTLLRAGDEVKEIHPQYVGRVAQIRDAFAALDQSQGAGAASRVEAQKRLVTAVEDMNSLASRALHDILRGKLMGSGFGQAASLSLGENFSVGWTPTQRHLAQRIVEHTRGQAIFADTQSVLSSLKGFVRGAVAEGHTRTQAYQDLGGMLEEFFTGLHRVQGGGMSEGIVALTTRNPTLTPSYVLPLQVYQNPQEMQTRGFFEAYVGSRAGQEELQKLQAAAQMQIRGFHDISRLPSNRETDIARKRFFRRMGMSLESWIGAEGGGRVIFPEMNVRVGYEDGTERVMQLNPWARMIGDQDGDQAQMLFLSGRDRRQLHQGMHAPEAFVQEMRAAYDFAHFQDLNKTGLKNLSRTIEAVSGVPTELQMVRESLMKLQASKNVGTLNNAIDVLRYGLVAFSGEADRNATRKAFNLLAAVQEIGNIKALKLPRYEPFVEMIQGSVAPILEQGDTRHFRSVMENYLFPGVDLGRGPRLTQAQVEGMGAMSGHLTQALHGYRTDLDDVYQVLARTAQRVNEAGLQNFMTADRTARYMGYSSPEARAGFVRSIQEAELFQAALAREQMGVLDEIQDTLSPMAHNVGAAVSRFDRRMLGPLAWGAVGSMALAGLLGDRGYAAEPLLMPGESLNGDLADAIRQGELFAGPSGSDLQGGGGPDIMGRPINIGGSYLARPNAYQIQGEVAHSGVIQPLLRWMGVSGVSGSLRINDARRPITPNYIDRFLEE